MESIALLNPYAILGLARGCDESDVRRRYLELVRQFPPDRARNVLPRFAGPMKNSAIRWCDCDRNCSIWNRAERSWTS